MSVCCKRVSRGVALDGARAGVAGRSARSRVRRRAGWTAPISQPAAIRRPHPPRASHRRRERRRGKRRRHRRSARRGAHHQARATACGSSRPTPPRSYSTSRRARAARWCSRPRARRSDRRVPRRERRDGDRGTGREVGARDARAHPTPRLRVRAAGARAGHRAQTRHRAGERRRGQGGRGPRTRAAAADGTGRAPRASCPRREGCVLRRVGRGGGRRDPGHSA